MGDPDPPPIGSGFQAPQYISRLGAFFYDVSRPGYITFGNVISGPTATIGELTAAGITYLTHELAHVPIARGLGIF
jgi:hypothetical protein